MFVVYELTIGLTGRGARSHRELDDRHPSRAGGYGYGASSFTYHLDANTDD